MSTAIMAGSLPEWVLVVSVGWTALTLVPLVVLFVIFVISMPAVLWWHCPRLVSRHVEVEGQLASEARLGAASSHETSFLPLGDTDHTGQRGCLDGERQPVEGNNEQESCDERG